MNADFQTLEMNPRRWIAAGLVHPRFSILHPFQSYLRSSASICGFFWL
jgi:hypothetical protein